MSDIITLDEILDIRASQELEDILVLPVAYNRQGTGTITSPHNWSDYVEIIFGMGISTGGDFGSGIIPADKIKHNPDGFASHVTYTDAFNKYVLNITAQTATTMSWSGTQDGNAFAVYPSWVVCRKKKYATTNLTKTIQVNGGNPITANRRYEIPASALPSEMLNDDGTIKKGVNVKSEIFINGKWGASGKYTRESTTGVNQTWFAEAHVFGDSIVVQTGITGIIVDSNLSGNPFGGAVGASSAPCKVIVILSGETYITQVAGG